MIDTGSASTLLSTSIVNKPFVNTEEVQPTETSCNVTSVDGTALNIKEKLDLQFGLGELMFQHEFLIADIDRYLRIRLLRAV